MDFGEQQVNKKKKLEAPSVASTTSMDDMQELRDLTAEIGRNSLQLERRVATLESVVLKAYMLPANSTYIQVPLEKGLIHTEKARTKMNPGPPHVWKALGLLMALRDDPQTPQAVKEELQKHTSQLAFDSKGNLSNMAPLIGVCTVRLTHDKANGIIKLAWPAWPEMESMLHERLRTLGRELHGADPQGPGPRQIRTMMGNLNMRMGPPFGGGAA